MQLDGLCARVEFSVLHQHSIDWRRFCQGTVCTSMTEHLPDSQLYSSTKVSNINTSE